MGYKSYSRAKVPTRPRAPKGGSGVTPAPRFAATDGTIGLAMGESGMSGPVVLRCEHCGGKWFDSAIEKCANCGAPL